MPDYQQQIIESLASGVIAVDADGCIIMANRAAGAHLNISENGLQPGVRLTDLPVMRPIVDVLGKVIETRAPINRQEVGLPLADGSTKEIGMSASLLDGPDDFNGVILLFTDMTERRALERAAELNRELASLGELTAGVVHELRNPLSVISGMAELLMRKLDGDDPRHHTATRIFEEASQLGKSISKFLGFARPFDLTFEHCHPDEVAQRAIDLCQRRAEKKKVEVDYRAPDNLPAFQADPQLVAHALANLIGNAIDAVSKEGKVAITAAVRDDHIVFEVSDDGPGINTDQDIFKPFVTGKESGTGLGLSVVHRVVTAHRGSVSVHNLDTGGACFELSLPIRPGGSGS
jgi:two-component system, NtrC family, sensor histidine kinase AtoS